jgi:hypothetical protein
MTLSNEGPAGEISMSGREGSGIRMALALCAAGLGAGSAGAQPTALPPDAIAAAERPAAFPHFADVPQIPKDIRPTAEWRRSVVSTRQAGAQTARQAARGPWTLGDSEAFAEQARTESAPPAPVTAPSTAADEAMVKALKARAIPPPRRH